MVLLLLFPTPATAQFKSFFDCGRTVRCLLPLGAGRLMHLFVLYGYQGADADAEQLSLTEQLFDAALCELCVVAWGQPCVRDGDFNVEPTKIPCLAKGISAGLWVDFEEAWALAAALQPSPTCIRDWGSLGGRRWDFMVGCPLAVAAVHSCRVQTGGLLLILLLGLFLIVVGGVAVLPSLCSVPSFGLPLGCLLLIKVGATSRLRFRGFGRFMMSVSSSCLVRTLCCWMSLLVLMMFLKLGLSGLGLVRLHLQMLFDVVVGLVLGRCSAVFRVARLGGHPVRKARTNVADVHDAADVFLYRDTSIAPLLDLRRWFKAVVDVLGAMIRSRIIAFGLLYPVTLLYMIFLWIGV